MSEKRSEGKILGSKLRKRAALMHKHGASRDLIAVILEAANRLASLARENENLRRKIEERGLFGPLSGVALGLSGFCKNHDCHIVRTLDGGFRAIRKGGNVPSGWRLLFDAPRGIKAAAMLSMLKDSEASEHGEPVGANRKPASRKGGYAGRVIPDGKGQAAKIAEFVINTVDLYRVEGGVRVVKADSNGVDGEFLGRFNEGATVQDIAEAISE